MQNIKKFHPGVYLKDSLETMGMTAMEFSVRTGISERTLSAVINGKNNITFDIAYNLSIFFDNSVSFWTNLQNQYDLYLKEQDEIKKIEDDYDLIKKNSLKKYLLECNYISENDSKEVIVKKAREIAGVNSLTLLTKKDTFVCLKEQKTSNESNNIFLQNFWVSLALKEARKNCYIYNKERLVSNVTEIKKLILLEPNIFLPKLKEIFEYCGISFVFLPYLAKSNIYGATKWLSHNNVMLAISNRSGKADLFWFTLFHELAHVLMAHRRETLFNIDGLEDKYADEMASNMILNKDNWNKFVENNIFTSSTIKKFAEENEVLPCIVLGRLHKEKLVSYGILDKTFNHTYKI